MTASRLYQQVQGTSTASGRVTLTFPAVPQGLVWTGSVSLYVTPTYTSGLNPTISTGPLQGTMWFLSKNLAPLLQMSGPAVAEDVQLLGQEVLTVNGINLPSGLAVTAILTGRSDDDASTAPIVAPSVSGSLAPYMQVYTDNTPGTALQVNIAPDNTRVVSPNIIFGSAAGTSTVVPSSGSSAVQLLSVSLNLAYGTTATTGSPGPLVAKLQLNDGAGTLTQLQALEVLVMPSGSDSVALTQDLAQMTLNPGTSVELVIGTVPTGCTVRVNGCMLTSAPIVRP